MNISGNLTLIDNKEYKQSENTSFISSLALAVIPIIIGGIVARYSTNFWQVKKDEIQIKTNILSDYDQSFKKQVVLYGTFIDRIFETYMVFENDGTCIPSTYYSDKTRGIQGFIKFPTDQNQQPLQKFSTDYQELLDELDETMFANDRFYSSLRLYYSNSTKIIQKLNAIDEKMNDCELIIAKLLHSTNGNDFVKFYNLYSALIEEIAVEIGNLELSLVKLRFK